MRRRRWLVGVGAATFFVAYIGSFGLVINTIGLTYLEGDPSPPPSRGYYFANDRTTNRSLYYFYYPLATCYGWIADAVFLETPPFCLESSASSASSGDTHKGPRVKGALPCPCFHRGRRGGSFPWCPSARKRNSDSCFARTGFAE